MASTIVKYNRQTNLISFIGVGVYNTNDSLSFENYIFNLKDITFIKTYIDNKANYVITLKCLQSGNHTFILHNWGVYDIVQLHSILIEDKSFELKSINGE